LFEHLDENELVASRDERVWGFAFPEPINDLAGLTQASGKSSEIAVTADETEAIYIASVQQVHGVDDESAVRAVLALGVGELLHRLDGMAV
jgi:hypothetical protein